MEKIRIDPDRPLNPGERVELHFKSSGMAWIKATQIALIERRLAGRKDWRILNFQTPVDQPTLLICTVELLGGAAPEDESIQRAGIGLNCIAIAAVIATAGVVYYLTLQDTFLLMAQTKKEIVTSPEGKVAIAGAGIGIAAAGIALLLFFVLPKS